MKKIYILPLLLLSACTTTKSDNHSYTYIHNYNASSQAVPEKNTAKPQRSYEYIDDEAPFYNQGMGRRQSAVIPDRPITGQQEPMRYNDYHPPLEGFGFTPMVRRHLVYGETRY